MIESRHVETAKQKTLVDNRPGNRMLDALRWLMGSARYLDVATGYFEVGAMVSLDGEWQKLQNIRLLMGDEVTRKTKKAFVEALQDRDRNGIERAQIEDDWKTLEGLQAIKAALAGGSLQARVYTRAKFHAKAYHFYTGGQVNHGLIGSSNFTHPGLTQNVELNLFTSDNTLLGELKDWYEEAWKEAEDLTPELLSTIEPHVREYFPFEIYVQAMREYFLDRETDQSNWEKSESRLYPILAKYQRDAYHDLIAMATEHGGALLCDGVGLGKTFVALMLIERARMERHKVLVIAPKSAIPSVWERNLNKFFPDDFGRYTDDIRVMAHTDFGRHGGISEDELAKLRQRYETIIIDEAHHFRMPYRNRSKKLKSLTKDRCVFMLTATPINNSIIDLYNLLNYVAQDRQSHYRSLGVPNLRAWFSRADSEKSDSQPELDLMVLPEYRDFLKHVLVQRSRKYVKSLEGQDDAAVKFPKRAPPVVVDYSLKAVYGALLPELLAALGSKKQGLKLVLYETEKFKESSQQDSQALQDQSNVVGLVLSMLLKRLESSQKAFEASVENLLLKHVVLLRDLQVLKFETWFAGNNDLYATLEQHRNERLSRIENDDDEEEDDLPLTTYENKKLNQIRADIKAFGKNEQSWMEGLEADLHILSSILKGLHSVISPENDAKLQAFIETIKSNTGLASNKFVVFSEFKDTARYLEQQLKRHFNAEEIVEVDSGRNVKSRELVIKRFAPYYNCETDVELAFALAEPIRILISTDVLSEGLNLQDANQIVNYDLHWNPVRLMQRIGRVDRRMDPSKPVDYENVYVFNFLPPKELDDLLNLNQRLTGKLVAINRLLGIEAPVLTANDEVAAMDFYQNLGDSVMTPQELLRLKAHELEALHPELWNESINFPNRIFSGKAGRPDTPVRSSGTLPKESPDGTPDAPVRYSGTELAGRPDTLVRSSGTLPKESPVSIAQPSGTGKLFLAYRVVNGFDAADPTKPTSSEVKWYLVDQATGEISESIEDIHAAIACHEGTPRAINMPQSDRTKLRKLAESGPLAKHTFRAGIPVNFKDELVCWMEVG